MTPRGRGIALAAAVVATSGAVLGAVHWWRGRNVGAVARGERIAQRSGCFGCHGRGGATGLEDPGRDIGGVPPLSPDALHAYAESPSELAEWVRDGMPRRVREELAEYPREGPEPLLQMPAFGDTLSEREIGDVAAWLSAVGGFDAPEEGAAAEGRAVAEELGCFGCHGPGGRGDLPNPGSLKGYVPAWDGPDFPELVRDGTELTEWILDGAPARLREHPVARWFLERQAVRMPAYRGRIERRELEAIGAYVSWLRGTSYAVDASASTKRATTRHPEPAGSSR